MASYYEILEVSAEATDTEIKKAYRRLAVKYHPDKNPGDKEAESKFKEIAQAYDILSNPEKRQMYDQYGESAFQNGRGGASYSDPFDIFSQFFGGGGGGGSVFDSIFGGGGGHSQDPNAPQDGSDLRYNLEIEFEEAVNGADRTIEFSRMDHCESCKGSGCEPGSQKKRCQRCGGHGQITVSQGFFTMMHECPSCKGAGSVPEKVCRKCGGTGRQKVRRSVQIRIPAGVDTGNRLRVSGEGEPGARGGTKGDLYVVLNVKESEIFQRDGDDIYCDVPISFTVAALGGEVEVPTVKGKEKFFVPSGTQSGEVHILRDKGMPSLRRNGVRGDQHLKFFVEVPKKLNNEQKTLLQQYAQSFDPQTKQEAHPIADRFFQRAKKFFLWFVSFFISVTI